MAAILEYNGIVLQEPGQTLAYVKTPEYGPGGDYLFTRYKVKVSGVYAPNSTSYASGDAGAVMAMAGKKPAVTEAAIRHKLAQPRGTLVYRNGGVVLKSPADGFTVDAANGPIVETQSVTEIHGTSAWLITLAFETCVNENPTPSVLLSHRWTREEELDEDFYSTITTRGRAIFRTDYLESEFADPDDFRAWLLHPVPQDFKREKVWVAASEDGTSLDYVTIDRQQASNIIAKGVSRIEALWTTGCITPGAEEFAVQVGEATFETIASGADAVGVDGIANPGKAATNVLRKGVGVAKTIRNNIPRFVNTFVVRVWGMPKSKRRALSQVALLVVIKTLGTLRLVAAPLGPVSVFLTCDLAGRFVELKVNIEGSAVGTVVEMVGGGGPFKIPDIFGPVADDDGIEGVLSVGSGTNPEPYGGRGSYLKRLASAALLGQDATPSKPTAPTDALNFQP